MPRRKAPVSNSKNSNLAQFETFEAEAFTDNVFIPNPDESDIDDEQSDSNDDNDDNDDDGDNIDDQSEGDHDEIYFPAQSYRRISENYTTTQKKLEPSHKYKWVDGEKMYDDELSNEILLIDKEKKEILSYSHVQLFELFFSKELKKYIIDATVNNSYPLTADRLDVFLGVLIFSVLNKRLSQRDYWCTDPLLRSEPIAEAMGRTEFENIKSHLKYSLPTDQVENDRVWRVRKMLNIFRENCMKFGVFTTAISIDEMMLKFYGRTLLKQFMKSKPIRFGIKMWALCGANGFLYDCDIYCGKNSNSDPILAKCAQGSRIVLQMLQNLFDKYKDSPRKLSQYHVYFDNLFCSPDLLVHLKKIGVRATGTLRKDRIEVSNDLDKKASRGTYGVKHDKNSGVNFITVMDSKPVSVLSTSAGVTPLSSVKRTDKAKRQKIDLPFPNAFTTYNKFMGGVDLHDQHCNKLLPVSRSKRWTWIILMRILQASLTNATVLYNTASKDKKKLTKKEVALSITRAYLAKSKVGLMENHHWITSKMQKRCSQPKCEVRTNKYCSDCRKYLCKTCNGITHI